MRIIYTLLLGLILISNTFVNGCDTGDSNVSHLDYTTYTNIPASYLIDYPVGWDCFEFDEYLWICPDDEFTMLAEIHTLEDGTNINDWLNAEPSWCNDFQIQSSQSDHASFTGKYGWTPIYGWVFLIKISDNNHLLTLLYSQDLFDCSASKIPDELNLIYDSFRQIQSDSLALPAYKPIPPSPLDVTVDQIYSEYKSDEMAAGNKFKGQRLLFSDVVIEEVSSFLKYPDAQVGQGFVFEKNPENVEIYIMNGFVKFKPRNTWDIFGMRVGYTVEIVGEVLGLVSDILVIEDCWIEVTGDEDDVVY